MEILLASESGLLYYFILPPMVKYIGFVILVWLVKPVHAASPEKTEALLDVLRVERNAEAIGEAINSLAVRLLGAQLQDAHITTEVADSLRATVEKNLQPVLDELTWSKIKPQFLRTYAEQFTDKEVDEIVAFYRSPTGKAFVEKQAVLNQQKREITQGMLAQYEPGIRALVEQVVKPYKDQMPPAAKQGKSPGRPALPPGATLQQRLEAAKAAGQPAAK